MRSEILTALFFALSIAAGESPAVGGNAVGARWASSSRLTPAEAADVLYREASGEPVSTDDVFEAEKHLRSDGPVSPSEYVLTEIFTRLLRRELGQRPLATTLRVPPPLLHWMHSQVTSTGVEIRGESVQLAVSDVGAETAVVDLRHHTFHHRWELCGGELCLSTLAAPERSGIGYRWSVLERADDVRPAASGSCDPSHPTDPDDAASRASALRYAAWQVLPDDTSRVFCRFAARRNASLRVAYVAAGAVVSPPTRASRGAVVNNPLELRLSE